MGIELDNAFNEYRGKTREGQDGECMAHAHDFKKNHRREEQESTKRVPGTPVRGVMRHKSTVPHH